MEASSVTARTPRLPRAERREQIVIAAAGVFVQGGFDGTSVDDVARSAGVTRLIVYRIFETKEALYRAVLDSVVVDLVGEFDARVDHARDALVTREQVASVMLRVARRHPDGFRLLWRQAAHEPTFAEMAAQFRVSVNAYAERLFEGFIADHVLRHWAAESVVAFLYESICLWLDHGDPAREEAFLAMLGGGLRSMIETWVASPADVTGNAPGATAVADATEPRSWSNHMSYPDSHLALLRSPGVAVLSTHTPDRTIQSTAIWYLLDDDGELKVSLSDARKKLRNLQTDPTVTFFLLDPANPFRFIEVRGTASLVVDEGFAFRAKVGAHYGADVSNFDKPGDVRYVLTILASTVNAQ